MQINNLIYLEGTNTTEYFILIEEGKEYLNARIRVPGDLTDADEDELKRQAEIYLTHLLNTDEFLHDLNSQQVELKSIVTEFNKQLSAVQSIVNDFVLFSDLTDEQMQEILSKYPILSVGDTVVEGSVYNINGTLYRAIQTVRIDAEDWLGNESLFVKFIPDEVDNTPIVADWVRPSGAHDAYNTGVAVKFDGKIYECIADNTVHSPSEYAQAWELVE